MPVGIESLHFQQGYNRDYESDDYFHDWLRIGYKCVTRKKAADGDDPVIWQDVQRDQTRSFDTGDYEFQADDFGSLRVFNVTCADQQGSGNKKVLRGLEVKRFETKGVQLGGKGRAAMENATSGIFVRCATFCRRWSRTSTALGSALPTAI